MISHLDGYLYFKYSKEVVVVVGKHDIKLVSSTSSKKCFETLKRLDYLGNTF